MAIAQGATTVGAFICDGVVDPTKFDMRAIVDAALGRKQKGGRGE